MESQERLLERAKGAFHQASSSSVLETIAWPKEVEEAFFASNEERLPEVKYEVDRAAAEALLGALTDLEKHLTGNEALPLLLRSYAESYKLSAQMVLAAGTPAFYALSREAYGGARTTALDADTTNLDFAEHLGNRLGDGSDDRAVGRHLSAEDLAEDVRERNARRTTELEIDIRFATDLSAKAIAGTKRLRIRADATFEPEEARSLYLHEVETHLLTSQNGSRQTHLSFLRGGGPKTTRTQEGLAVFSEFFSQAITVSRMRRLVERVRLVAMAEDGASFIDLYRHLRELGLDRHSAFLDCSRVCRGGVISGGAPFTKDASYLSGFIEVYNFLRLAVAGRSRDVAEILVSGRLSLDDIQPLRELRRTGVLEPPAFLPSWLRHWNDVLTHFAFTSFLNQVDIAFVARRFPWLETPPKP